MKKLFLLFPILKSSFQVVATRCAKTPEEMLLEIGADIKAPSFWDGGLNYLEKMIDQLEALLED